TGSSRYPVIEYPASRSCLDSGGGGRYNWAGLALRFHQGRDVVMFGIGLPELIVILAVGLLVLGPQKLPELAKGLGKMVAEFRKAAGALKEGLQVEDRSWQEPARRAPAVLDVPRPGPNETPRGEEPTAASGAEPSQSSESLRVAARPPAQDAGAEPPSAGRATGNPGS
ncbi:MAG: twin-arginine translocase TatA/TatE family subunit, partial [Thermodesulfobacteriota bacterium]